MRLGAPEIDMHRMGARPRILVVADKHAQLCRFMRGDIWRCVGVDPRSWGIARRIYGAADRLRAGGRTRYETCRHGRRDDRRHRGKRKMREKSLTSPAHTNVPKSVPSPKCCNNARQPSGFRGVQKNHGSNMENA